MESWTSQPINSQLIAIKLKNKINKSWVYLKCPAKFSLQIWPSPPHVHVSVYTHTHAHSRLKHTWNSEKALSLLMPILACPPCLWSEKVSRPGSSLPGGSGGGRPWPPAARTVWGSGQWGPQLLASKFGPRVEIGPGFCHDSCWKTPPWFFTL